MSGRYGAHAEYQESGLDWVGRIPKSWELRRLGSYFQERRTKVSDADFSALSVTMQGIVPQLETAAKTDDGGNRKLVRAGDFVINSFTDPVNLLTDDEYSTPYAILEAIDTRNATAFRYFETGSPFEYELVRMLYTQMRELEIAK